MWGGREHPIPRDVKHIVDNRPQGVVEKQLEGVLQRTELVSFKIPLQARDQPGQDSETRSLPKKINQLWWQVPVVPATWEAEAGELLEPRR